MYSQKLFIIIRFINLKMQKNKLSPKLILALTILSLVFSVSLFTDTRNVSAQNGPYPVSTLTDANDFNFLLQVQAVSFSNGKWTYRFIWNRTRNAEGRVTISPAVNQYSYTGSLDPAPKERGVNNPLTVELEPATRYTFRYYAAPGAECGTNPDSSTDPDCVAIRTISFNTRDANGNIVATSDIPISKGGTKVETTTTLPNAVTAITSGSGSDLQSQINQLLALVQTLIQQLSAQGVSLSNITLPTTTGTTSPTSTTNNTTQTTTSGPVFFSVGTNANLEGGIRQAAEPILVVTNPTYTRVFHSLAGGQDGTEMVENGTLTREIWVYATEGRKFLTWVGYSGSNCSDSSIQIQRSWSLPSGITFKQSCSNQGGAITDGVLEGSARSAGEYTSTITTTKTTSTGTVKAVTKIRFFVLKSNQSWPVTVNPIGSDGLQTSGILNQGARAVINWSQDTQVQGSFFSSLVDIWIAPLSGNSGKHPDFVTNKQLVATGGEAGGLISDCNNSTRGGGDPYKTGCGSYNWVVGKTLGQNMAPGEYIIYVTPHLPAASNSVIGSLYGGCGLIKDPTGSRVTLNPLQTQTVFGGNSSTGTGLKPQTDCFGYSYGSTRITIAQPTSGSELPSTSPGILLASFSDIEGGLSYTRRNSSGQVVKQGSVGIGTGSNSDQAGCTANETAGTSCGITINANVGDTLQIDWKSMYRGQPAGHAFDSNIWVSGPFDRGNATELAAIRDCTQNIAPGGFGPTPSQGFMNSYQGSKTFSINSCLSGKVLYLTYTVWMYGCGNVAGGENYVASQTNPNLVLSSGQTTCRLAVKGEGTIVVNVDRNSNIGEIVSGVTKSVPTAPYVENTFCTTSNSEDPAFVAGNKFIAAWNYPNIAFNPLKDKLVFRSAKGASYSYQNNQWVKTNTTLDETARNAVNMGCPAGTTCHIKDNDVLANPNDPYRQETYYWVTDTQPATTYWNRIAFVKDFGLSTQTIITEKTWSCNTQSGNTPR